MVCEEGRHVMAPSPNQEGDFEDSEKPCGRDRGCGQWERSSRLLAKAALTLPQADSQAGEVGL